MAYVYKCTHKSDGTFYIGYRASHTLSPADDLPRYRTSSRSVRTNFDDFETVILFETECGETAYRIEQQLIYDSWCDPKLINRSCFHDKDGMFRRVGPHNESTKRKISEANKGRSHPHTEETKRKISSAKAGIPKSKEHRLKIGDVHRGKVESQETRQKKTAARVGKIHSPETLAKLSANSGRAQTVTIEGVTYPSMKVAARELYPNLCYKTARKRISGVLRP